MKAIIVTFSFYPIIPPRSWDTLTDPDGKGTKTREKLLTRPKVSRKYLVGSKIP